MAEEHWKPGRVLAHRYRLESRLGEGGMGSIWRAEHLVLAAPVALKLIDPEIAEDEDATARFMREAQAAATLRSSHVVQILDYGFDGKVPFMAMELLEGENLAQRIKRLGRVPPAETARILTHVARAVARAHEAGIVHRDLKPENVFIVKNEDEEVAKVLDFGVAKVDRKIIGPTAVTRTGSLLGTPYYMSPEQAQGNKTVDFRSDLWSLGVIAYECLIGKRPFYSDAIGDLVLQICVREIPVPSHHGIVPEGFDAWFARAVARDPELRFQSARDLTEALRDALGLPGRETIATLSGIESGARAPKTSSNPEIIAAPPADEAPFSQAPTIAVSGAQQKPSLTVRQFGTTTKTVPPTSSSAAIVLLVAGGALAIGLVAGFVVLNNRSKPPESAPLEFPTAPVPASPPLKPAKKAQPAPDPEVSVTPFSEAPAEAEAPLDPRSKREPGSRREGSSKPQASAASAPIDTGRRDGGYVKPAWAIPDDELPPKATPPPSAAPAPPPSPPPAPSAR
jgi:eukaryotic-like serine/threonine-protein kinase